MRGALVAVAVLILGSGAARAQDETWPIIEKAIKAHGGAEQFAKQKASHTKGKGTLELLGGVAFTQETKAYNGKFKEEMKLNINGMDVAVTTGYDGNQAWVNANGQTLELDEKIQNEVKQALHNMRLGRFPVLKEAKYKRTPLGEKQVNGKPAVGVKVQTDGFKDVNLYFDKETGLLAMTERVALDGMTMQEVNEERIVTEYQEVSGVKMAKKLLVNRDGKKFMEIEILEVKMPEKIDDSEFAKP